MLAFLEGPDLVIVALIVLLVFGGSRIPHLARSLGEAQREFRKGLQDDPPPSDGAPKAEPAGAERADEPAPPVDVAPPDQPST